MYFKRVFSFVLKFICFGCATVTIRPALCLEDDCLPGSPTTPTCPLISEQEVERTFLEFRNVTNEREFLDRMLIEEGMTIDPTAKVSDISNLRRHWRGPIIHSYEQNQLPFHAVTDALVKKYNLTQLQIQEMLPLVPFTGPYSSKAKSACSEIFPIPNCNATSKYREINGTCNNLEHPLWGSANTCIRRLLPAHYTGDSGFRESVLGGTLPPPRDLSVNIHNYLNLPSNSVTMLSVFFGQFIAHDVTQTPISVTAVNITIDCCLVKDNTHPQCAAIPIKPDDYFYSGFGVRCINFVRSAICPTCSLGHRDQLNELTAFIDGSMVYGNHEDENIALRSNDGTGRLRVYPTEHGDLLPKSAHPENDQCSFLDTNLLCFDSGDARSNQHNSLTALHTLFLRVHNKLADRLKILNPQWDGEKIFLEARRIVGAKLQVVAYKEWLPAVIGSDKASSFSLNILNDGFTDYDPSVDPSVYNEFSTAVMRFGHSLLSSAVTDIPTPHGNKTRLLRNDYFKSYELASGHIETYLAGNSKKPCQFFNPHMVPDVTNFLFRRFHGQAGLDLPAINIQRGRDHGLPPYSALAAYCSDDMVEINDFDDLAKYDLVSCDIVELLKANYRHVDDIDFFTGLLSETPIQNSFIGPTGACILGQQFHNMKFGDRFYFEHRNQAGTFSNDQLQELRKVTMSKIICEHTEVQKMPVNALKLESDTNPLTDCGSYPSFDLSFWKE